MNLDLGSMNRLLGAIVLSGCIAAVAGCGSTAARPAPPVRLTVSGPSDHTVTLAGVVSVRGTVTPADATVLVAGHPAPVKDGSFTAQVPLAPGTNVIDVLAGARKSTGAVSAVRIYRELPVTVPQLAGASPSRAEAWLSQLGLRPTVLETGGFLQSLIPTSKKVCRTTPAAGASLPPGSSVRVEVAKIC